MKLKFLCVLCLSFILSACNSYTEVSESTINELEESIVDFVETKEEIIVDNDDMIKENKIEHELDEILLDIVIDNSNKYTEEEIKDALLKVYDNFIIPDANLIKLYYDEDKSDELKNHFMETGRGSVIDGLSKDNVIVILSEFKLSDDSINPVLEAGETYIDYPWYLVRVNTNDDWILDSAGYE